MGASFWFVREMAPRRMSLTDLVERRMLALTALPRIHAPLAKATTEWPCRRRRDCSRNCGETLLGSADLGHRAEQAFGVRMMCAAEELSRRRFFHHFTRIHHDHARAVLGDHT